MYHGACQDCGEVPPSPPSQEAFKDTLLDDLLAEAYDEGEDREIHLSDWQEVSCLE